ncbi:hypothetical protein [Streptomyces sp. NRRL S-340]|uniref:hypothetical protein n=1 Tax=Streptomyces sp. NRRL S-340 TaxID=1463901 RepID=UPI000567CCAE|nr:hypothetical protein [Streptomyces sp. NRRL S-340]
MNRIAARIASGTITALLVVGGAGVAQADSTGADGVRQPASATQTAVPGHEAAPVSPLTNDWG